MKFSENLKALRKEYGYTARELSAKISCSTNLIYDWEHGRCEPSFSVLISLASIFDCTIGQLLGAEDDFGNISSGRAFDLNSEDEQRLLSAFRLLDHYEKETILIQVNALAKEKTVIKK